MREYQSNGGDALFGLEVHVHYRFLSQTTQTTPQGALYLVRYEKSMPIAYCQILHPFQIIDRLTFLTLSLTIRPIQKFVQNITFFCCDLLYQYMFFKNELNLTMFA